MSTGSGPNHVLIIRHGEKLGDPSTDESGGPDLSIRGSTRAAALPSLFLPATPPLACTLAVESKAGFSGTYNQVNLQGEPARFPTPQFLFATQASKNSNRPLETITPLSAALQLEINSKHPDGDYGKVATDILNNGKYDGSIVLICWHHGKIQDLATALHVASPPKWPGSVFDRVWHITYTNRVASLQDLPQMLLYGDSDS
jgi:hypothetical protein